MSSKVSPSTRAGERVVGGAPRTWFITGAGRGLGRAFAVAALQAGDRVVATVRRRDALTSLQRAHPDELLVLSMDVRDRARVAAVVDQAFDWAGHLDVIVNNAGQGFVGAAEELDEADIRDHLDLNLLGPIWVCQAVLPRLRARGSGHIVQISTTGAVGTMPTLGLYNAGKWGLEGFSEALAAEVAPWGIRVTIAEPGGFDTDWGGTSMRFAAPLAAYDDLRRGLFGTEVVPWPAVGGGHGEVPGDQRVGEPGARAPSEDQVSGAPGDAHPAVAAAALLAHVDAPDGPLRLLVGADAPEQVAAALEARCRDYGRDPRFTWPTA